MRDVFILGAGFSKAISSSMPVLLELGNRVLETQKRVHNATVGTTHSSICDGLSCDEPLLPSGGAPDFEAWLSSLAEPQPYLLGPENDRRRALFDSLAELIALDVRASEHNTMRSVSGLGAPPHWLAQLVTAWHERRCTVITFNYDTLVEATVDFLPLTSHTSGQTFEHRLLGPVVIPLWTAMWPVSPVASFDYCKLHGSVHWRWDAASRSATSMVQVGLYSGWGKTEPAYSPGELDERAPGKASVIVPPTMVKGSYLDNRTLRLIWHYAYRGLIGASRVFVIGYSLPEGDTLVRSLLAEGLRGKPDTQLWVVDKCASVADRFASLGVTVNSRHAGEGAFRGVEVFVDQYLGGG